MLSEISVNFFTHFLRVPANFRLYQKETHDIIYLRVGISWLRSDKYHWAVSLEAAFYTADFLVTALTLFLSRRSFPSFTSMNFSKMSLLIRIFLPTFRQGSFPHSTRFLMVFLPTLVHSDASSIVIAIFVSVIDSPPCKLRYAIFLY